MRVTAPRRGRVVLAGRLACLACLACLAACGSGESRPALGGDPANGRLLIRQFGCGKCHEVPGVADARGNQGPSLERIARRVYLAGRLPNRPENMVHWIRNPQGVDPATLMPDLQVSEAHARDIVAYLYTLDR